MDTFSLGFAQDCLERACMTLPPSPPHTWQGQAQAACASQLRDLRLALLRLSSTLAEARARTALVEASSLRCVAP